HLFVTNSTDNSVSAFNISPSAMVDAYEDSNNLVMNFAAANPATGMVYTLRLPNLYAINEAAAGAGADGTRQNKAGVTAIPLAHFDQGSLAVNVATNKIYAGDGPGFTYIVDGQTNTPTLISAIPASANIGALAVDYATNQILAWDSVSGNVFVLDGAT